MMAFGLILGSAAIATALAFGLGGRDAAGRIADHWAARITGPTAPPPPPKRIRGGGHAGPDDDSQPPLV
jgi:hypothetical protein